MWINEEVEAEIGSVTKHHIENIIKIELDEDVKKLIENYIKEIKLLLRLETKFMSYDEIREIDLGNTKFKVILVKPNNIHVDREHKYYLDKLRETIMDFKEFWLDKIDDEYTLLLIKGNKLIDIVNQKIIHGFKIIGNIENAKIADNIIFAKVYINTRRERIPIKDWYRKNIKFNAEIEPINLKDYYIQYLIKSGALNFKIEKEDKLYKGEIIFKYRKDLLLDILVNGFTEVIEEPMEKFLEKIRNAERIKNINKKYSEKLNEIVKQKYNIKEIYKNYVFSHIQVEDGRLEKLLQNYGKIFIGYNIREEILNTFKQINNEYCIVF